MDQYKYIAGPTLSQAPDISQLEKFSHRKFCPLAAWSKFPPSPVQPPTHSMGECFKNCQTKD